MKFIIRQAKNKQFYFVIKAKNGEIIATSETYLTKQSCKVGIRSVKLSLFAKIIDETS